jgi:superfamily II DNA or RNA helicase
MNTEDNFPDATPSLTAGDVVIHPRHGQGEVLFARDLTTVVRFLHGLEELRTSELVRVLGLLSAVKSGFVSPTAEVVLRAQALAIRSVNDAWGVFSKSRISLLPHQLWVCHRALRTWPIRKLVADDVGMGKTIEAGLILWPLVAKGAVRRLLILTPAKLVEQWQERLRTMFDIRLSMYRPEVDTPKADFWSTHNSVVASLPTLRADNNGRHERLLDAPEWDMVMVDEAHHLYADESGKKTLSLQLVERLQERGKINSCVLFTGTPHRGKDYGFWSLMGVLDKRFGPKRPEALMLEALPLFLIRNAKQKATDMEGVRLFQPVKQYPETFSYSPEEALFYALMTDFIQAGKAYASELSEKQRGQVILVLIALQKLASSSVAAVRGALEARQGRMDAEAERIRRELSDDSDDPEADELQRTLQQWAKEGRQGQIKLMEDESRHLEELLNAARSVEHETRIDRIIQIIDQRFADQSVLLFTEYKKTQALMMSALMARYGTDCVGFINGDNRLDRVTLPSGTMTTKVAARDATCDAFNAGKIRFLISTEAGGEGIDLQQRCSALIHIDLPWNPMRLHQRVGRLNRYGQKHAVEVVSLRNPDTVEGMIWGKLETKLGAIMQALGAAMDEPEDLLQLVLGMTSPGFFDEVFSQAKDISKEKLSSWFDEKTRTFGGASAIDTVTKLVGHSQSFDLSGLKDVPPIDLPALKPFFMNMLAYNGRRPKHEGQNISFKTPEKWLNHPAIRRDYTGMTFDRAIKPNQQGDLVGVGHPLVTRAMREADSFTGGVAIARGLEYPVLILQICDRVTDGSSHVQEILVGVEAKTNGNCFLKDWQLLLIMNEIGMGDVIKSSLPDSSFLLNWIETAKAEVYGHLVNLDLPFAVPEVRELILMWPCNFEVSVT